MKDTFGTLARMLQALLRVLLYFFTLGFVTELIAWVRAVCARNRRNKSLRERRRGQPMDCEPKCANVSPEIYKRADPMIYSQTYLMEQGLAVTWDNPDIQLFEGGVPVPSSQLQAGKTYEVVATIYNNSTDAPAVGLPVEFAFRDFGVGSTTTTIDSTVIDLPVKGAPDHPAFAKVLWTTPNVAGHYCLITTLVWPDDANPKNNVGQENTDVGVAASPAHFEFPVRNEDTIAKRVNMTADAYVLPRQLDCDRRPTKKDSERRHADRKRPNVYVPPLEKEADWLLARARHALSAFPIPEGWAVDIQPSAFSLAPGASQQVSVAITPPDSFHGERPFNINAMHRGDLLGGVTLMVSRG